MSTRWVPVVLTVKPAAPAPEPDSVMGAPAPTHMMFALPAAVFEPAVLMVDEVPPVTAENGKYTLCHHHGQAVNGIGGWWKT